MLEYARAQLAAIERYMDTMDENDLHETKINHPFALDLDKEHLPSLDTLKERIAYRTVSQGIGGIGKEFADLYRSGMRHDAGKGGRYKGMP